MRRIRSLVPALAFAAALAGEARPLSAAEPRRTAALGWVRLPGAEGCIDARELAVAVEQRFGRAVFVSPAQADMLLEGRIEPAGPGGAGFRVHLALTSAGGALLGTRDLEGSSGACRALDEDLVLVVALLLDPQAALPPRPPPAGERVVVERIFVPVPTAPPPAPERWRESLALGPAFALGLLPGPGFALSVRGEITPPSLFPLELGGVTFADARAVPAGAASSSSKGATVSLSYGMLGLCPLAWRSERIRVAGCADLEVGAFRAVGYGFTSGAGVGQEQPIVQASIAGRAAVRLVGPLEIGLGLGLVVPLRAARVYFEDAAGTQQELFRMAAVAGVAEPWLAVAFP